MLRYRGCLLVMEGVGFAFRDRDFPDLQAWFILDAEDEVIDRTDLDIVVSGSAVNQIPVGEFTYVGTAIEGTLGGTYLNEENEPVTQFYWGGIFEMNVDFSAGRGSIEMTNGNPSNSNENWSNLSGNFNINMADATLHGNNLTYVRENFILGDYDGEATVYGSFHGEEAVGVSGIFYGNSDRKFAGGLIGARRLYTRPKNDS